jgi:hypothetical protein
MTQCEKHQQDMEVNTEQFAARPQNGDHHQKKSHTVAHLEPESMKDRTRRTRIGERQKHFHLGKNLMDQAIHNSTTKSHPEEPQQKDQTSTISQINLELRECQHDQMMETMEHHDELQPEQGHGWRWEGGWDSSGGRLILRARGSCIEGSVLYELLMTRIPSHFLTNWPKRVFCRVRQSRALPRSLVHADADADVMAKVHTTSSGDRDVITVPIHYMNLMRLANCIALVTLFMLHLRPISTIDDSMSIEALLRFAKRDSAGVSNTRRVLFLRLAALFRASRRRVRCSRKIESRCNT